MSRRSLLMIGWVLFGIASLAFVAVLSGVTFPPAQLLGGLAQAWLAPGYALLLVLFPRDLNLPSRVVLSVPISAVIAILLGVLFDSVFQTLSGPAFVISQWGLTAILMGLSLIPRRTHAITSPRVSEDRPPRSRFVVMGLALGIVLVLGAGVWSAIGIVAATNAVATPYTALAMEGSGPERRVVIANAEGHQERYSLELVIDGVATQRWDDIVVDTSSQYALVLQPPASGNTAQLRLYRDQDTKPYRTVQVN